jgi:L-alanine-DL-glutamate epimerase-like enolase superfamily enzyme
MRDALATSGKTPELCIDVNEYWSPKQAIRYMHVIEQEYDITWIEEPARRWDAEGLRKVSDNVRAAVASGENLHSLEDFVPLLSRRAVDVLNIGAGASGITGAMKLAALAYAYETPVTMMNCAANYMAHLAATLPNHIMMEVLERPRRRAHPHAPHRRRLDRTQRRAGAGLYLRRGETEGVRRRRPRQPLWLGSTHRCRDVSGGTRRVTDLHYRARQCAMR